MKTYLIVDGYNVIHFSADKRGSSDINLEEERESLIQMVADYSGYMDYETTIVFDAYYQEEIESRSETRSGIDVVFTGKGITADSYIERRVYEIMGNSREARRRNRNQVIVVTSDNAVQQLVLANGGTRMASRELFLEIDRVRENARKIRKKPSEPAYNRIGEQMESNLRDTLNAMRKADIESDEQ